MGTYLDARTSQNASVANLISIPITAINTPQLFGQIGLLTAGVILRGLFIPIRPIRYLQVYICCIVFYLWRRSSHGS